MISYIIYTILSLGCSYAVYVLFLRKQKTFQFNRFFLIGSMLLCFLAPFIRIELFEAVPSIIEIPVQAFNDSEAIFHEKEDIVFGDPTLVSQPQTPPIIYIFIISSLFLFVRFFKNIIKIYSLTRDKYERLGKLKLIRNTDSDMVSSFFNYVFVSENQDLRDDNFLNIIRHERVHCEQLHSVDVILIELLICLFWFNPFIWFYKKSILQNHEYIADDKSVASGIDIENYSNTIINLGHKLYRVPLTSGFNFIQIKNRIIMLHQSKSSVLNRTLRISTVILLFAGIFTLSSCKDLDDSLTDDPLRNDPLIVVIDAGHGGKDAGQLSGNSAEKDIVLHISNQLSLLSDHKIHLITTRDDDSFTSLKDRVNFINAQNADLVISLHCNAYSDESFNGVEAYYYDQNDFGDKSYNYSAILLEKQMELFSNNRGIKTASMYVLKHVNSPAVVLELGFITNNNDKSILINSENQKEIAASIFEGLMEIRDQK
ncbi:N-acetylmuramoyl-L-alanine amidase [Psychroserpens sp. SPM9]|uniref:N-acetylmuramoyl-L-alanine amidase n=1 Tax=Psychroserpens sp. SPM9 TaxID=2975598 RepID=UPI0021A73B27|nr:N-acetylmuramoyl-L-alanine amidase [Psychroserpens sp. SPM9]MDG5492155.1 N-acetylmuramoyl-L-alanine amidase [Psychroserpens sp. SPM9]